MKASRILFYGFILFFTLPLTASVFGMGSSLSDESPANERPLFGEPDYESYVAHRSPAVKEVDERFVRGITQEMGHEQAFKNALQLAWQFYSEGDLKTSIKRFNQALLIEHDNYNAYWGLGAVLGSQKQYDESLALFKKAKDLFTPSKEYAAGDYLTFLRDYANIYNEKMDTLKDGPAKNEAAAELILFATTATQAPVVEGKEAMLADIYLMWAKALYVQKNFSESWEKIHVARQILPALLNEPERAHFIAQLKEKMPEPEAQQTPSTT